MSILREITAEEARVVAKQHEGGIGEMLAQIYTRVRVAAAVPEFAVFVRRLDGEAQDRLRRAGVELERKGFKVAWLEESDGLLVRWDRVEGPL